MADLSYRSLYQISRVWLTALFRALGKRATWMTFPIPSWIDWQRWVCPELVPERLDGKKLDENIAPVNIQK